MTLQTILTALFIVYLITVIIAIISQDRDPTDTIAWIIFLAMFPVFGLIFYFFAGRDWRGWLQDQAWVKEWVDKRMAYMQRFYAKFAGFSEQQLDEFGGTVSGYVARTTMSCQKAPVLPATSYDIYPSGEEYFPVLLADLAKAEKSIWMQYFIWEHDELTAKITEVLIDRLKHGVEVKLMNDYLGCLPYKKDELNRVRDAGGKVEWDMTEIGRLNYRNHRKITVIDGVVGHSGGFNIGQEYIDGKPKYPAWRDTGLRITGPAVIELAKLFSDRWREVKNESLLKDEYFAAAETPYGDNALAVQVTAHGVEDFWESSRRAHGVAIGHAEKRVWLQSPYFIPDPGTYEAMINAALSGVDVRLMMTDWPDHKAALHAAESYYLKLLLAGARIFRYTKGFFHAKSLTVDGLASAVGTMNLDTRSLKLHKEMMVWCFDEGVARRMEEIFEDDLKDCREITLEEVQGWSRTTRFRNSASRLGSNTM